MALLFTFFWRGEISPNISNSQNCAPYSDIGSVVKAGDVKGCDCLTDMSQKKQCQTNISDATFYVNALKQVNPSLCYSISILEMKNTCLKLVQGKLDYYNKSKILTASSTK